MEDLALAGGKEKGKKEGEGRKLTRSPRNRMSTSLAAPPTTSSPSANTSRVTSGSLHRGELSLIWSCLLSFAHSALRNSDFNTNVLKYVISEIGVDRLMFSVDYPYETFELACNWFDGLTAEEVGITEEELLSVARNKAIEVCGLKL